MESSSCLQSVNDVVQELMRMHRSLPTRPSIDEVDAAKVLVSTVENEYQVKVEAISRLSKPPDVPDELFGVLQEMQKNLVYFHSVEQKREALKLLDLEGVHSLFDEFIQKASDCINCSSSASSGSRKPSSFANGSAAASKVSSSWGKPVPVPASVSGSRVFDKPSAALSSSAGANYLEKEPVKAKDLFTRDDSYVKKTKSPLSSSFYLDRVGASSTGVSLTMPQIQDSSLRSAVASGQEGDKLSLIKLATFIELSAKKGTRELNLHNKLAAQVEWLPDSIGKLSSLVTLDLSENRILTLPDTIGGLSSLGKLDLHSNRLAELPESIGNLLGLICLNLRGNQLSSLPASIGSLNRLEELDVSSNELTGLPDTIGALVTLKKLIVETNNIEELPHSIGRCSSLKELCADYNRLKALPEAVGKIASLEILSVRYNNIKQLPTTMSSLTSLRELDISFNELELVPESLCFATALVKMNIGNNFADLRSLPRSIGNLEMLEELDISNNQIRVLPESFRMLTRLRVLRAEENPLEVPPRHILENGAQAVVQYMAGLVEKEDVSIQSVKPKKSWVQLCFFSKSNKRMRTSIG